MSSRWLFSAVIAALVAACNPPNIAAYCSANGGCDHDLVCDTTVAGGYCTVPCTVRGTFDVCPDNAICDDVKGANECVRLCGSKAECRPDQECNGVSDTNFKACKPK